MNLVLDMPMCRICKSSNLDKMGFYCDDCGACQVGCFRKTDEFCSCDKCMNRVEMAIQGELSN